MSTVKEKTYSENTESPRRDTDRRKATGQLKTVIDFFGSLKLTVTLLVLSIFLIFVGTLAQIDQGVWTVVKDYFRSWYVWVDFQLFFPRTNSVPGAFPFPGGWTLGNLLLINLLVAHFQRFNLSKEKIGLFLVHSGLILLLIGEGVTGLMAEESMMSIDEGSSSNYSEDIRHPELAFVDRSDKDTDTVTVIPEGKLRGQKLIKDDRLPFDVQIDRYFKNSVMERGDEGGFVAREMPEVSGTAASGGRIDMPALLVTLYKKGTSETVGSFTTSVWLKSSHSVVANNKAYDMSLRFARSYKPFSLYLKDFEFDRYPGTEIPKNFASTVQIQDPANSVNREVKIWMNHPLRYGGETYYQASYKPDETGTVLQVVENPGWLLPYISCILVTLGLILQFGFSLSRSLKRRKKKSLSAKGASA